MRQRDASSLNAPLRDFFFKFSFEFLFHLLLQENARMLMGQPPRPPGPTPAQRARMKAVQVDRVSRVLFPGLFALLNGTYWLVFLLIS